MGEEKVREIIMHSATGAELCAVSLVPETARFAGYVPSELTDTEKSVLKKIISSVASVAKPCACYTFMPITIDFEHSRVDFDGAFCADSVILCRCLDTCTHAVLLTATLGLEVDRCIESARAVSLETEYLTNAAGTALIEQYADIICDALSAKFFEAGYFTTERFGVGYGDLSLSLQKNFLDITEAGKRLSIALTAGNLMLPRKTITAIIGVKHKEARRYRSYDE